MKGSAASSQASRWPTWHGCWCECALAASAAIPPDDHSRDRARQPHRARPPSQRYADRLQKHISKVGQFWRRARGLPIERRGRIWAPLPDEEAKARVKRRPGSGSGGTNRRRPARAGTSCPGTTTAAAQSRRAWSARARRLGAIPMACLPLGRAASAES